MRISGNLLRVLTIALMAIGLLSPIACNTYEITYVQGSEGARGTQVVSDDDAKQFYLQMALPTVLVKAETGTGSGVVFGDDLVLTAAHVITAEEAHPCDDGTRCVVRTVEAVAILKNEGLVPFISDATVVKINHDLDLAVLKLAQAYPYAKAKFASADPELYEKCWISGHPHGVTDPMVTEGRVQDLWEAGFIMYSAPTTFGNSGGPVWLKEGKEYRVSSVCQMVFTEGFGTAVNHMGLGAMPSKLKEFLGDLAK